MARRAAPKRTSTDPVPEGRAEIPTRRERQRADTRERLFRAALDEFRRVGFAAAEIDRIARRAGVVRGTFYFHFPSKEHVLHELQRQNEAALLARLCDLRAQRAPLEEALRALADTAVAQAAELGSRDLMRDALVLHIRSRVAAEVDDRPRILEELGAYLAELGERGELRSDLPCDLLAASILTSFFGCVAAGAAGASEWRERLDVLFRVLTAGLAPR